MSKAIKTFLIVMVISLIFTSISYSISFGGRECSSCSAVKNEEENVLNSVQDEINNDAKDGKEAGEQTLEEPFINDNSSGMGNQIDDVLESNSAIDQN